MPFTDKQVQALRPKKLRYELPEPGGLAIRVTPNGQKTWTWRFRWRGRQQRLVFGSYPALSLADVRLKIAEAKQQLDAGQNPGAQLAAARALTQSAATIDDMVQAYLRHAADTMRPATVREDRRIIDKEILSTWRGLLAKDITRKDVMSLLNAIQKRGVYVMRNRVAGVLSRLFLFGLDEGLVDASPAIKLRRLKKIGNKKVEQARKNVLTKEQIHSFWKHVDTIPVTPPMRAALKWLLVTGQRRSEVAGTLRSEIDDAQALWTLPAGRTKNEREQLLPLPSLALHVLAEADGARVRPKPTRLNRKDRRLYDATPSRWLFPSVHDDKPISPQALTYALVRHRRALGIGAGTVHDMRRSFATAHGELGTPPDILSALLGHAPNTITKQVYDHSQLLGEKRKAMERYSAWLSRVIEGQQTKGDVVRLKGGTR